MGRGPASSSPLRRLRFWRTARRRRRGDMNPDDMRAGRMLAQGDLRLVALALIAQAPRHGYEIIKLVEEKTADWYSPEPRHRLSDADLSGRSRLRHRGDRRLEKALHHHRRRPRLSRGQSRSRRRRARPADRARRTHQSLAARRARRTRAIGARLPPLVEAAFDHLREAVGKRLEGDAEAEASLVEILARTDAELRRRAETRTSQRAAASGVCTCSGRIPMPSSRAGMRRSTGKRSNSLNNSGGFGRRSLCQHAADRSASGW